MIIRDPVHGLLEFSGLELEVLEALLDTREVQRLRHIRQMGVASLAFPGAEHTRFGHSLGTASVMSRLCQRLGATACSTTGMDEGTVAAAVAAALLHDVGHPPLSHMMEAALPGLPAHERWSLEIVGSAETDVGAVLADLGMTEEVSALLDGTHEAGFLCDALSSPLDVDRMDYLLRDSHHTGVRYGQFDLQWLLSSLRTAEAPTPAGRRVVLAVDGRRGLRAVEGYLQARLSMFQQVYFHKTGRAAEFMFRKVLDRVAALIREGAPPPEPLPPAMGALLSGRCPTLQDYLDLDDAVVWTCVKGWQRSSDPVLAALCDGLRRRRLLRSVPLPRHLDEAEAEPSILEQLRSATAAAGFDPDWFCGVDRAIDVPYHVDPGASERIWVVGLGRSGPLAEVSPIVEVLRGWQVGRTILICPREARDRLVRELE